MTLIYIFNTLCKLLYGLKYTLFIVIISSFIGLVLGSLLAVMQISSNRLLNLSVTIYVTIIRGTPMLLQITFLYLILPHFGLYISSVFTAILAISLNSAAYVSQIIKVGILSINKGQIEAARTLGINSYDITRYIILPQAISIAVPALSNEIITLIKDSSLAALIGVNELFKRGEIIISQTNDAITVYILLALIYLLINTFISIVLNFIERRIKTC